jgi:hypothetical protein
VYQNIYNISSSAAYFILSGLYAYQLCFILAVKGSWRLSSVTKHRIGVPAKVHRCTRHTGVGISPSPESRNNVGNLASGTSDPSPRGTSYLGTQTVSAEKGLDRETGLNTGLIIIIITITTTIMRSLIQYSPEHNSSSTGSFPPPRFRGRHSLSRPVLHAGCRRNADRFENEGNRMIWNIGTEPPWLPRHS